MEKIFQISAQRLRLPVLFLLLSLVPVAAQTSNTVTGHIGFAFPLVSTNGSETTTLGNQFQVVFPVGIGLKGPGRLSFDLELDPAIQQSPTDVSLTISPGLLWGIGHGFTVGGRLAFVASSVTWGFTGVVIKSWPIQDSFFKSYFVEGDLPVRFVRPNGGGSENTFGFNIHFGVGF
jgi:hypothetical protein